MRKLTIPELDEQLAQHLQRESEEHGRPIEDVAHSLLKQALERDGLPALTDDDDDEIGIEHIELVVDTPPCNDKEGHREHTRVEYGDIRARFSFGATTRRFLLFTRMFPCEVVDISIRGACIHSDRELKAKESITLYFSGAGSEQVAITGAVIRVKRLTATRFEYGVQFSAVMPQGELRALVCRKVIEMKVK